MFPPVPTYATIIFLNKRTWLVIAYSVDKKRVSSTCSVGDCYTNRQALKTHVNRHIVANKQIFPECSLYLKAKEKFGAGGTYKGK